MIVSIVTFKLPKRWTVEEAAAVSKSTAPKYLHKPGLVRKHYFVTETGDRAGGIYLWKTKQTPRRVTRLNGRTWLPQSTVRHRISCMQMFRCRWTTFKR